MQLIFSVLLPFSQQALQLWSHSEVAVAPNAVQNQAFIAFNRVFCCWVQIHVKNQTERNMKSSFLLVKTLFNPLFSANVVGKKSVLST